MSVGLTKAADYYQNAPGLVLSARRMHYASKKTKLCDSQESRRARRLCSVIGGRAVFRWQRTLAKNPLGVAPDMYTPKCAPQRAACSGARHQARFASARAQGPGNSQVPPSCAPIILHKIKTKRSHTRNAPPLYSVFCALPFGVSLFTQLFVSFWESWCQVFCFFLSTFSQASGWLRRYSSSKGLSVFGCTFLSVLACLSARQF